MTGEFGKAEKVHQAGTMQLRFAEHNAQQTERLPPDPNGKWQFSKATGVFVGRTIICLGSPCLSNEGRSCLEAELSIRVTVSPSAIVARRQFQSMTHCACCCASHCRSSSPPGSAGRGFS
tara:strand:- start:183 stop:542 length:360 start_codon:yes stop_codon:yes gene_type:complete